MAEVMVLTRQLTLPVRHFNCLKRALVLLCDFWPGSKITVRFRLVNVAVFEMEQHPRRQKYAENKASNVKRVRVPSLALRLLIPQAHLDG